MKVKKTNAKNRRLSAGPQKRAKRNIHVRGEWKAIELDPSLFSEEGMEGLVCFEELTNYRLVDPKKAAAKTAKQLKKEKKKAMKRKASEGEEGDVESNEKGETTEPAKKKNKKRNVKESVQPEAVSAVVTQEDVAAGEEEGEDETAKEVTLRDIKIIKSDPNAQSKPAKKRSKKKKKTQVQQIEKDGVAREQSIEESPSELQALEKEKSTKDNVTKPPKKQQKNWTNVALSHCKDKTADVSAWKDLFVPSPVLKALSGLGFGSPTPIQALALPSAIRDRMDILGAAETGEMKYLCSYVL